MFLGVQLANAIDTVMDRSIAVVWLAGSPELSRAPAGSGTTGAGGPPTTGLAPPTIPAQDRRRLWEHCESLIEP